MSKALYCNDSILPMLSWAMPRAMPAVNLSRAWAWIDRSTPYNQILKGVQAGIVFIFLGGGLLRLHAWNIGDEGPLVFGTLALALGLGFGVAAAVSYFLSRSFGLLSR